MNKLLELKIKIFADGANIKEMFSLNDKKYISGLTTNPSLMKQQNINDYKTFAKKILKKIKKKPLSFEVTSDTLEEMEKQAIEISSWSKNIYVKIPFLNSKGMKTTRLIKKLSQKGIKINVTALFTIQQVKNVLKSLDKNSVAYLSIFAGRIADTGVDPAPIIKKSVKLSKKFKNVEILWASVREPYNYLQAKQLGCHIITIPPSIILKIEKFGKTFDQLTKETVKAFLIDSKKSRFKI